MHILDRRRPLRGLIAASSVAVATLSLAACTSDSSGEVVVGFYPLEYLADSIGGDAVQVVNLAQPGMEPHDMELTAKQVGAVSSSALVVYIHGLQPALDDAVQNERPAHVLDVTTVTDLAGGYEALDDHGEEATGQHEEDTTLDPHVWLNPALMLTIADAVKDSLIEIDQENEAAYESNFAGLSEKLTQLDADFTSGLAQCERTSFVTTHNAFGYLAKAYGLEQVGISGLSDEEPSPQRLAEVKQYVEDNGVTTIFFEEAVSDKYAATLAAETGTQTAVLNPLEVEPETGDYVAAMEQNLQELRTALGCA